MYQGSRGLRAGVGWGGSREALFLTPGPRSTTETTRGDIFLFPSRVREEASGFPRPLQTPAGKCQQEEGATLPPILQPRAQQGAPLAQAGFCPQQQAPCPYRLHQLPRQGLGVVLVDVFLLPVLREEGSWGPGAWPGAPPWLHCTGCSKRCFPCHQAPWSGGHPYAPMPMGSRELSGEHSVPIGVGVCRCVYTCVHVRKVCLQVCACSRSSHKLAVSRDAVTTSSSSDHPSTLRGEAGCDSTPILELR